jgi:aquaporin Z
MQIGRRALAEAIGTYFLVLIGPGAAMVNAHSGGAIGHPGVALSVAFVVLAMVYAVGHISGAHLNPAVTIAFASVRRFPLREVIPYTAAQCAGAVAASFTMGWVVGPVGSFGATVPSIGVPQAFAVEWLLSFILMLVIMAVATDTRVAEGFGGVAVGLTVGFCVMAGGPLTGASMNPARSLGPAVAGGIWTVHWIYWAAPILGTAVAARAYELLRSAGATSVPAGVPMGTESSIAAIARDDAVLTVIAS